MTATIKDRIVAHRSAPDVYDPPTFEQMAAYIDGLEAKLAKAVEALTPSRNTKLAYIAEVDADCPCGRQRTVSWTATKEIMQMIRRRAEINGNKQ